MTKAIKEDLAKCVDHVKEYKTQNSLTKSITDSEFRSIFNSFTFSLGQADLNIKIQISKNTCGRKAQVKEMLGIFDHWYSTDPSERTGVLLNLAGPIGIGKSSFLQALSTHALMEGKLGGIVSANIPLTNFSIPLVGICSILEQLVANMLSEPPTIIRSWEQMIKKSLGEDKLRNLVGLVPNLSFIIGESQSVSTLPSPQLDDSEFHRTIQVFLSHFCSFEEPLLLCFDSLQAGPGSLSLLKYLVTSPLGRKCFFVGYSDNGEDVLAKRTNITAAMIARELSGIDLQTIQIPYLNCSEIEEFLKETLAPSLEDYHALAKVMTERTKGNYLLLREYILLCEKKGLITFDLAETHWKWDLTKIKSNLEVSKGEALDIVMNQFKEQSLSCQKTLKYAACIGISFEITLLSEIMGVPNSVIQPELTAAISSGYVTASPSVIPYHQEPSFSSHFERPQLTQSYSFHEPSFQTSNASMMSFRKSTTAAESELEELTTKHFRFCNETLYENIRKCIPTEEFQQISLSIARKLNSKSSNHTDGSIVDVVRHYNNCLEIVTDDDEILSIAQLNVTLGLKYATDFAATAVQYFEDAEKLFTKVGSQSPGMIQTKLYLAKFYLLSNNGTDKVNRLVDSLEKLQPGNILQSQIKLLKMCLLLEKQEFNQALEIFTQLNLPTDTRFKKLLEECPTAESLLTSFMDTMRVCCEQELTVLDKQSRDYIYDSLLIAGRICSKNQNDLQACYFKLMVIKY